MKKKICSIAECGNTLAEHAKHDECPVCRSSFSYWKRKRPAQMLERRRKLTKFSDRMDAIMPANVSLITKNAGRKHA